MPDHGVDINSIVWEEAKGVGERVERDHTPLPLAARARGRQHYRNASEIGWAVPRPRHQDDIPSAVRMQTVQFLLEHGAGLHYQGPNSAVHTRSAIKSLSRSLLPVRDARHRTPSVTSLSSQGFTDVFEYDWYMPRQTVIYDAIEVGRRDLVELLLEHGATECHVVDGRSLGFCEYPMKCGQHELAELFAVRDVPPRKELTVASNAWRR